MISYTAYFQILLDDLRDLLAAEFTTMAVIIGDTTNLDTMPRIVLEPYSKKLDSEKTYVNKEMNFVMHFWVFVYHTDEEDKLNTLTDIAEHLEQLLLNNKKYPTSNDGSKWENSWPEGDIDYGAMNKAGSLIRSALLKWRFKKYAAR